MCAYLRCIFLLPMTDILMREGLLVYALGQNLRCITRHLMRTIGDSYDYIR